MKKVVVASSRKFYDEVRKLKAELDKRGINGFYPKFDFCDDSVEENEKLKKQLTLRYFPAINETDILYIFAKGGYVGISVAVETSYAYAKTKEIISSEPLAELALRALVSKVMLPKEFVKYVEKK